jgi:anti-sigma factor RsiW
MTQREYTIRDIHMALDGEMPAEDREGYENWLAANPDMKAASQRFTADRSRLQSALDAVFKEPVPDRLANMLSDAPPSGASWNWLTSRISWKPAAAAALVLFSAAIGYYAGTSGERRSERGDEAVVERALQAHVMYAAEKLHVVEVGADQKDHLVGWLSKRVGTPLVAPDLSADGGFQLVGGRLLPAAGHPAAQFMYQDRAGVRISLYVTPDAVNAETGFRLYEEDGARTFYWIDDGFCYAVSGGIPEKTLLDIASAAYRQLLDRTTG